MRLTTRTFVLLVTAALAGQVATAPATASRSATPGPLTADFARAAAEFDVPGICWSPSPTGSRGWTGTGSTQPGQRVRGHAPRQQSHPAQPGAGRHAHRRTDRPPALGHSDKRAGGAAVLRDLADSEGLTSGARDRISAWYPAVARYSAATDQSTARLYADHVYDLLRTGIAAGPVRVAPRPLRPELGRYAKIPAAGTAGANVAAAVPEYPPARWVSAYGGNYQVGRSARITTVVVHVTQGRTPAR
ncbi:hypothetical protein NKG94_04820 [Micromonospora sp. M12]